MQFISDEQLARFVARQESQFVRDHTYWLDLVDEIEAGGVAVTGDTLPWPKTSEQIRLRPKEVTIYAGIGGSGKSLVSGQIALDLLSRGRKVVIASLEMAPERTIHRMRQQWAGSERSTPAQRKSFADIPGFWIYDQTGRVKAERLMGLLGHSGEELGVNYVIIDSLFMVGLKELDEQAEFINALCWAAKKYNYHIILIHHLRKGVDTKHVPNGFDIRGASELRDGPDNVILHWKNSPKMDKKEAGEPVNPNEPDALLIVDKQRHGEWTGKIGLFFHHPSHQHTEQPFNSSVTTYT
jgi:twinkle protein